MNNQERNIDLELMHLISKCYIFVIFMGLLTLGVILNFYVIVNNGGRMPVYYSYEDSYEFETDKHFSYNNFSDVNYPYISDIFGGKFLKFSIGDIMIWIGSIGVLISLFHFRKLINKIKKMQKETPNVAGKYS